MDVTTSHGRPLQGVVANRWASVGGGAGVVLSGAVLALLVSLRELEAPASSQEDELEFLPGTLAKLGTAEADRGDGSNDVVAPSSPTQPSTTPTEPSAVAPPTPPPTTQPSTPPSSGSTSPSRPPSRAGGGKLPGPAAHAGTPFGDPNGWDELTRDGDPWATAVLAALNHMVVRPFGGDSGPGTVRFVLTVCKDGKRTEITRKGGTAAPRTHDAVAIAVEQLELPRIPAMLAKTMADDCMKIRYTFEWRDDRVE